MSLDLLFEQVLLRDFALFVFRVAGERNGLHPVQKGARHVVGIRGRQEHDIREVVLDLHVVIGERRVLFGIQHFQHRGCGISPKVVTHLVDLVEQDEWIDGLGLLHALDDLAGHRTDIGSPVPADFRLVAHAAQADANELAAGCPCH